MAVDLVTNCLTLIQFIQERHGGQVAFRGRDYFDYSTLKNIPLIYVEQLSHEIRDFLAEKRLDKCKDYRYRIQNLGDN